MSVTPTSHQQVGLTSVTKYTLYQTTFSQECIRACCKMSPSLRQVKPNHWFNHQSLAYPSGYGGNWCTQVSGCTFVTGAYTSPFMCIQSWWSCSTGHFESMQQIESWWHPNKDSNMIECEIFGFSCKIQSWWAGWAGGCLLISASQTVGDILLTGSEWSSRCSNPPLWVVTKTRNGMERNRVFRPVLFRIFRPEAIQSLSLNPKNFDLGIPNPKSKLFC